MLSFRPFRNTDPPALAELWRSRAGQRGLRQPASVELLEQLVFAKLYFDYDGLIIAREEGRPVGFAHVGFGPDPGRPRVATDCGVVCVILVRPGCAEQEVAAGLLARCEDYLRRRGARTIQGGGSGDLCPFYLGLYGGATLPGVLDSDPPARDAFQRAGYEEVERSVLLERDFEAFEAPIDRRQMQIRRQMIVEVTSDPPARSWWEACTLGEFDLVRFDLMPRGSGAPAASAVFRSMEPGAVLAGRPVGLVELVVEESYRRRGLAVFLVSEACRQFLRQGVSAVEAVVPQDHLAALGLFHKLGFRQAGQGSVFRKGLEG
jgi:ribosomal protein S18 acetylase RimI-like enzyme